jgi:hypothetical protein
MEQSDTGSSVGTTLLVGSVIPAVTIDPFRNKFFRVNRTFSIMWHQFRFYTIAWGVMACI